MVLDNLISHIKTAHARGSISTFARSVFYREERSAKLTKLFSSALQYFFDSTTGLK